MKLSMDKIAAGRFVKGRWETALHSPDIHTPTSTLPSLPHCPENPHHLLSPDARLIFFSYDHLLVSLNQLFFQCSIPPLLLPRLSRRSLHEPILLVVRLVGKVEAEPRNIVEKI